MVVGRNRRRRGVILVASLCGALLCAGVWLLPAAASAAEIVGETPNTSLAAFDPASGRWYLHQPGGRYPSESFFFGRPGDQPLMGDWDCDGTDTVGMFRTGTGFAYLRNDNSTGSADHEFFFGSAGDIALAGDWDGDGCDTLGVYRPSTGKAYLRNSLDTGADDVSFFFGNPGDRPFAADFDGDGFDALGLYRESTGFVYLRNSLTSGFAEVAFYYGEPADQFLTGDWDGDGYETVGVSRERDATLYLRNDNSQGFADTSFRFSDSDLVVLGGVFSVEGPGDPDLARIFPGNRVVAYYGNHQVPAMGVLGETGPQQAAVRVREAAAPYGTTRRPAIGAFEMIVTVAQAKPGADGNYSAPTAHEDLRPWLDAALANDLLVIFDIQPGRSDFLTEAKRYEDLLKEPHVGLALDPEWRMGPSGVPGQGVGQVDASEVNAVSQWLSDLVVENDLPDKLFIVHQFQLRMITNREQLVARPGLNSVIHMDGFGGRALKQTTYRYVQVEPPPFYNGFKLFFDEDTNLYQPWEVLQFETVPDLITYQ